MSSKRYIFATHNLDHGRSAAAQLVTLDRLIPQAHVTLVQELIAPTARLHADIVWRPFRARPRTKAGTEAIIVEGLRVVGRHRRVSAWRLFGERIGYRNFVAADIVLPGIDTVRAVDVHFPRAGMSRLLHRLYARRLRAFLRESPHPWIVGGDWNSRTPQGMRRAFPGSRYYSAPKTKGSSGIDGFLLHRALVDNYAGHSAQVQVARRDGHPFVLLELESR
jgi:endonuclease/exonuclease/phosphatase family metal-dependent hydrolase